MNKDLLKAINTALFHINVCLDGTFYETGFTRQLLQTHSTLTFQLTQHFKHLFRENVTKLIMTLRIIKDLIILLTLLLE